MNKWLQWYFSDFSDYSDYSDFSDFNNFNDYRDSDLDWERFSELVTLVTKLTITDKLQNLNHDIEG